MSHADSAPASANVSLDEALRANRIPSENHATIRKLTAAIGVKSFSQTASARYVKAHRIDGGPDLFIEFGFTNGFVSEDEIIAIDPLLDREPSTVRKGLWVVWHPTNGKHSNGASAARSRREKDYGTCPDCRQLYSATGACWC